MKYLYVVLLPLLILSGCSAATFQTNIGSYAKHKYRMIAVKEYSHQEMLTYQAKSLGGLSASYCQERIDAPKANESVVIDKLKTKVYRRGGNGLVVDQCRSVKNVSCKSFVQCHGVAYQVPDS